MKLAAFLIFLFILPVFLPQGNVLAQTDQNDSSYYDAAIRNAVVLYQQSEKDQARIMNGRQYKPYTFPFVKGFPFFLTRQFSESSIIYDGGYYDHILLLYDEILELVILNKGVFIELINEKIEEFTIAGHKFYPLFKDSANNLPTSGFYEILYDGNIDVYKKEKKSIVDVLSTTEGYQAEAVEKKFYYIKKDDRYYLVKKKADLLKVLGDKKSEIQQFIRKNKLDIKRDKDNVLPKIATYYDQLTR